MTSCFRPRIYFAINLPLKRAQRQHLLQHRVVPLDGGDQRLAAAAAPPHGAAIAPELRHDLPQGRAHAIAPHVHLFSSSSGEIRPSSLLVRPARCSVRPLSPLVIDKAWTSTPRKLRKTCALIHLGTAQRPATWNASLVAISGARRRSTAASPSRILAKKDHIQVSRCCR